MEIKRFIRIINEDEDIKSCFNSLKDFWLENKEKYPVRLAHGFYHLAMVAYKAYMLAKNFPEVSGKEAYIAGMLHEPYRPIGSEEEHVDLSKDRLGEEEHAKESKKLAKEIIERANIESIDEESILNAIERHHGDEGILKTDLDKILFVADKADMKEERVFGYIWDWNHVVAEEKKVKSINEVLGAFMKKMFRDKRRMPPIIGFTSALDALDETYTVLSILSRKEAQGDIDLADCFDIYALREAILNLQFLRSMEVPYDEIYEILGVYNDLLYGLKEGKIGYLDEYFRETEKYRSGHL